MPHAVPENQQSKRGSQGDTLEITALHETLQTLHREREEQQQAITLLQNRYDDLYNASPIGYLTLGGYDTIVEGNATAAEMLGVRQEHLGNHSFTDFLVSQDQDIFHLHRRQLFKTQQKQTCEIRLRSLDNPVRYVQLESLPARYVDGEITQFRMAIIDISRHKQELKSLWESEFRYGMVFDDASDRTTRKQVEDALRESERRYKRITDAATDYIYTVRLQDGQPAETIHRPSSVAVTGYTPEEFAADPFLWINMVPEQDREAVKKQAQDILAGRDVKPLEHRIIRKDETLRWVKNTCVPHTDNEGKLLSYDGLIQDISERKQVEEALRASEQRFRTIANFTYDWETWIGPGRNFLYVSPSCERMTGYPPQAFYHDPDLLLKMSHPDDCARVQTHLREEFMNEEVHFLDFRILTAAGEERWIGHICQAVYNYAGEWVGRRSSNRDITEQKQAKSALRLSEARLRQIIDLVPHQIFVRDRQGCYVLVNKTAAASRGITPEQMQGKCCHELPGGQAQELPQYLENDLEVLASGKSKYLPEVVFTLPGEPPRSFEVFKIPYIVSGSEEPAVLGIALDITDRKLAEERLKQAMVELKRSNADLEQFAYAASHDLQQPLLMVDCYVQLLLKRYRAQLGADADEFLDGIVHGVERMQILIKDLLEYSRLHKPDKNMRSIDCDDILAKALQILQVLIEEHQAVITHTALPRVKANHSQFVRLFQNLIGNAIKFRGAESPRIHISARQQEQQWIFAVEDNGIGIASQDMQRIFVIFERLHSRDQYPGTGIGLAMCKKIIEQHGGRIWVESEPGEGSTFYFTVPVE